MIAMTFSSFHEVSLGQRREIFFVSSVNEFSTAITFVTLLPSFVFLNRVLFFLPFFYDYSKKIAKIHKSFFPCSNSVVVDFTSSRYFTTPT